MRHPLTRLVPPAPASPVAQVLPSGTIRRSGLAGAGAFFKASAIPLAIFELKKCSAVAPHVHPDGAETIFVLQGGWRVTRCGRGAWG